MNIKKTFLWLSTGCLLNTVKEVSWIWFCFGNVLLTNVAFKTSRQDFLDVLKPVVRPWFAKTPAEGMGIQFDSGGAGSGLWELTNDWAFQEGGPKEKGTQTSCPNRGWTEELQRIVWEKCVFWTCKHLLVVKFNKIKSHVVLLWEFFLIWINNTLTHFDDDFKRASN